MWLLDANMDVHLLGVLSELGIPFSIIVVHLPQKPWREYIRQFRIAWEKQPIAPNPGLVLHWPAD